MPAPELRQTLLVSSACLLLGAACGWWLHGDSSSQTVAVENPALAKNQSTPSPSAAVHEVSPAVEPEPAPIPFATAIRAAFDDRDPLSRGIRLREIIRALAAADLPAAVEAAVRLPNDEQSEICRLLGARWGEIDPRAGLAFAENASMRVRRALIGNIAARWAANDPTAAVAWLNAKPGDRDRETALASIIDELSQRDSANALGLLQMLPQTPASIQAHGELFARWAARDPQAAGAAAVLLANADARNLAIQILAGSWAKRDAASALAWAGQITDPRLRANALDVTMVEWTEIEPDAALAWALAQPDEKLRASAIRSLGATDPARAAEVFTKQFPANFDPNMASDIVTSWVQKDASTAARWVEDLPQSNGRALAYFNVSQKWAQTDPIGAAQWLQRLPVGPARDAAIGGFSWEAFDRDPNSAIEWLKTVSDTSVRAARFERIAGKWLVADPDAAKKWIRGTDQLPPETKKQLLERQ